MISVSGCFGNGEPLYEQLDTAAEAAAVVDELEQLEQSDAATLGEQYLLTVQDFTRVASEYARRIRLLTWAVVAIVVYLVLKEAKQ